MILGIDKKHEGWSGRDRRCKDLGSFHRECADSAEILKRTEMYREYSEIINRICKQQIICAEEYDAASLKVTGNVSFLSQLARKMLEKPSLGTQI